MSNERGTEALTRELLEALRERNAHRAERDTAREELRRAREHRDMACAEQARGRREVERLTRELRTVRQALYEAADTVDPEATAEIERLSAELRSARLLHGTDASVGDLLSKQLDHARKETDTARAENERLTRELRVTARERDQLREQLDAEREVTGWMGRMTGDGIEGRILGLLADRLRAGRKVYGSWRGDSARNYNREALEEVVDALAYCAAELLRRDDRGGVS